MTGLALETMRERADDARNRGLFDEADELYASALDVLAGSPETDEVLCQVLYERALVLYGLGRFAEGEGCLRRALTGREKALGAGAAETIETLARLAEAIGEQGRWVEARALAHEAARLGRASLGIDHVVRAGALMASTWVAVSSGGRHADEVARATVAALEDTPYAGSARNLLVRALRESGQFEEAERVAREALPLREAELGPDHPHTLLLRGDLALTLHGAGRPDEALAVAGEALDVSERALGSQAPCTVRLRHVQEAIAAGPADVR